MIGNFLKKQKEKKNKIKIITTMIQSLQIPEKQKFLYIGAIEILDTEGLKSLYLNLSKFVDELEIKDLEEINRNNFTQITGMRKKEAIEKQKELNSFSFLINNL